MKWSAELRNAVVDAWSALIGASPKVRVYGGPVPANESAALGTATLLVEFDLASTWVSAAVNGVKTLLNTPITANASASGNASFYRVYKSNGSTSCEQGSVGVSDADMLIDNVSIQSGQPVRITSWTKTAPHG